MQHSRQAVVSISRSDVIPFKMLAAMGASGAGIDFELDDQGGVFRKTVFIKVTSENEGSVEAYFRQFLLPLTGVLPDFCLIERTARTYFESLKRWYESEQNH